MFSVDWPAPKQVKTIQTTRKGGVSLPPFDSLNLGSHVGDDVRCVTQNRALLPIQGSIEWLNQVHGNVVIELPLTTELKDQALPIEADAAYTFEKGQVCAVMTADCLPVLITDLQGRFVAAVHCGWRGLNNHILTRTLTKIMSRLGISTEHILVWFGPAIGPLEFEVGEAVRKQFVIKHDLYQACFVAVKSSSESEIIKPSTALEESKWLANIYSLAAVELNLLGIKKIYSDYECTVTQSDKYFSYRRDKQTGRQASLIWLE